MPPILTLIFLRFLLLYILPDCRYHFSFPLLRQAGDIIIIVLSFIKFILRQEEQYRSHFLLFDKGYGKASLWFYYVNTWKSKVSSKRRQNWLLFQFQQCFFVEVKLPWWLDNYQSKHCHLRLFLAFSFFFLLII